MRSRPTAARSGMARREELLGYLFIAPWLAGFVLLTLGPMLASLALSFADYQIVAPPKFVGLRNFEKILVDDPAFRDAVRVTATYAAAAVPLSLVASLAIALLMNQRVPGVRLWRTIYYLPAVVSGVAVAMLWTWIFHSEFGLINLALRMVGIKGPAWLANPDWALWALVLMSLWSVGSGMIIKLAGLQGIPSELYEAATVDGAGAWRRFWSITLPMLSPVLFFNVVMGIIATFQYFTNAYVMTNGGPGRATLFYNLYLYQNAFSYFKMGYASALAWILFLIILALTLVIFRSSPYWVYYEGQTKGR
jgi:multiple sugar transport system permease protein